MGATRTSEQIAAEKQFTRDSLIPVSWRLKNTSFPPGSNVTGVPNTCGILTAEEIKITSNYDAVDIVERIRDNTFSAEAVTVAFCKRAAIAQQLVNCLTEIFFDEAIAAAKDLDAKRKANPHAPLGPLHGLPISLKDSFDIPGKDSSIGIILYANDPATKLATLPQILQDLGAILYCKTNVPQTMMTADTHNNVWERTLNPHNTALTAGGSTGGEGALIALRGSIAGIGTDIAGSVRIPAICNGIYSIKPTAQIIPFGGQRAPVEEGIPSYLPSAGPMTSSIRGSRFLLENIMRAEPWKQDPFSLRIPWTGTAKPTPVNQLRIGVVADDGIYTPSPPIRRAFEESVAKLKAAGANIVPVTLPSVEEIGEAAGKYHSLDGGKFIEDVILRGNEPIVPSVRRLGLVGDPNAHPLTLPELYKVNAIRGKHIYQYGEFWRSNNLDVILMPPSPHTAVPHDTWRVINYTVIWNYLDYPAAILPTGFVSSADAKDGNVKYGAEDQSIYEQYTGPEEYHDAPIGVQLVGKPLDDENFSILAEYLDGIINSRN